MKRFIYALLAIGILLSGLEPAFSQATNFGFSPIGSTQNLSVTSASGNVLLNSSPGDTVLIQNTGSNTAYVKCGTTAATTDIPLQAGWGIALNCPPSNRVAAITASSTTTLTITKGLGNFVMTGGGVGSGGSGIVVTGTTSNSSSAVATSSTNIPVVNYNYVWNGATWDQATGLVAGTAGSPSTQVVTVQGITSGTPVITQGASTGGGFPTGATAISGNATGTTGAVVGTLAATSAKTTYICGFSISATGGVATLGPIVIAGLITASQTYQLFSTATGANLNVPFTPCIPASATNTAITITTTADGTASAVDVNSWGYQQ